MPYTDAARQALSEYDIADYSLEFIRHSDNVTFRVDSPGSDSFLLRIHIPVSETMGAHGSDSAMVLSELLWLEALNRDTDLVLQRPVKNRAGELVTRHQLKNTTPKVNCTLLRWVEGESYHRDLETEQTASCIGEMLATLHNHANLWEIPERFKRPRRDMPYFDDVLRVVHTAKQDGRIEASDYTELETSIGLVTEMMSALDENDRNHGIMHADSHKGNLLYHNGHIRLIDFSFCAFGSFMFDLAVCLSDMKETLHQTFFESYQRLRLLPDDYQRLIEGFFVGSMVGTFSFWVENPRAQEILKRKVPQISSDFAARFNRGERFWFS